MELAEPYTRQYGVKLNRSDLSQYLSGKVEPGQEKLSILAMALDVDEAWLMGYDVPQRHSAAMDNTIPFGFEPLPTTVRLPLVGQIACGTPILAEQNLEDYIDAPASLHATFALRCHGDSMAPNIQDGDLVYIRRQPMVDNGEIAAVRIGNEATLKRVHASASQLILLPDNHSYTPQVYTGPDLEDVAIEGKVVGIFRVMEGR